MPTTEFKFGDRLVHTARPEWGAGVVTAAQAVMQDGVACQRLTIRFERGGLKTLTTNLASLRYADEVALAPADEPQQGVGPSDQGWLGQLESGKLTEIMARLPEATRDPFSTLSSRLHATLALYRFTDQGAALLDWAAMQTGLKDPMNRFNRHELEVFFKRFAFERDAHLKRIAQEVRKNPPADLSKVISEAPKAGRDALQRLHLER